jgi:hypothetical protein
MDINSDTLHLGIDTTTIIAYIHSTLVTSLSLKESVHLQILYNAIKMSEVIWSLNNSE